MFQEPILLDLPIPIKTERPNIRPMMLGDGREVFKMIDESREFLQKWIV